MTISVSIHIDCGCSGHIEKHFSNYLGDNSRGGSVKKEVKLRLAF